LNGCGKVPETNLQLETCKLNAETRPVRWEKVSLIGVGLLGGSLGLALKQRRLAREVIGYVRRRVSIAECERAGAVDRATLNLEAAVQDAELIVICTPLGRMAALAREFAPSLGGGTIVTDVGSVKSSVVTGLEKLIGDAGGFFIGSHPMAGSEKAGVTAARADLFEEAFCVVTPTPRSEPGALRRVEQLWRSVGSRVMRLGPALHDELVSRSSHLPHLVAASLANMVLDPKVRREQGLLCANGFRDTTRIASGSPEMWRDIALANQKGIGRALDSFIANLRRLRRDLKRGNRAAITRFLETAKRRRDDWSTRARSSSPE